MSPSHSHPLKALVLVANGTEEMEAVTTIDVLRRANIHVTVAGVEGKGVVECSRGVKLVPDAAFNDVVNDPFDIVILPGGLQGAETFASSQTVHALLKHYESHHKYVGAICAAPIAFPASKTFQNKSITSYPSMKEKLSQAYAYDDVSRVVVDGKLITSRGPGTATEFALKIVETLLGKEAMEKVKGPMLVA